MKIKVTEMPFDEVMKRPLPPSFVPKKPNIFFRTLMRVASIPELMQTSFTFTEIGTEKIGKAQPCLYLMNHSCFLDLKIASRILYPKPYQIVCTQDGFIGKYSLMRQMGCLPKKKFVSEYSLLKNMTYALNKLGTSVLMYPEASYSFDGRTTPLPDSIGKCLKLLKVPVVMIKTFGAFAHDPLYNGLQQRKVKVSAEVKYLLSPEEIAEKTPEELNEIVNKEFDIDYFSWQRENHISISEPFRADKLNRVLYKCPHCLKEGMMEGHGCRIECKSCKISYVLDEYGVLSAESGETKFSHIPDWFAWERECVRKEISDGSYCIETDVDICMFVDYSSIYKIGEGHLVHNKEGFTLTGCDGKLDYRQSPISSYSLYSDYFWYEIGDVICIGDKEHLYYCFPKSSGDIVSKARIATEEMYKLAQSTIKD